MKFLSGHLRRGAFGFEVQAWRVAWVLALLYGIGVPAQALAQSAPVQSTKAPGRAQPELALPETIVRLMQTLELPEQSLSVVVREVDSGAEPMHHRADEMRTPASLIKLVTTQAALDLLGPAFVWQTPLYVSGPIQGGVLRGDVYVKGSGDPKFNLEAATKLLQSLKGMGGATH